MKIWRRRIAFFLASMLLLMSVLPCNASQIEENVDQARTIIRVAFYPLDGFFEYDEEGNEVGYGVELLDKISQYTGIEFQYVEAESWESTKYMLLDGEADLRMPATMPMTPSTTLDYNKSSILDTYHVMLTLDTRDDLFYQDYDVIRTLKIAISNSFYEVTNVKDYLDEIGVTEDQLVFCEEYNDCRDMLLAGEVDALVTNIMDMESNMKMLARFNSISNYFSMLLDNPDLEILDEALSQIKLDEPLFLANLYQKWFPDRTVVPFTMDECEYLSTLDSLTFAFQTNEGYLSRYEDGEFYGIYTEMAKAICEKLGVEYNAVSITDCLNGEASTDVYAGFFYDQNYAEEWDFSISVPLNDINYYIIQKKEKSYNEKTCVIAAVPQFRYTTDYLKNKYSEEQFLYYDTYEECLQAVANGKADITVINNYIAEYYLEMYQFSDLTARLTTDYSHMICFAELAQEEKNNPESVQDSVTKIQSSGEYILGLINDVLDVSKIESGKVELRTEIVNGPQFLNNIADEFRGQANAKGITLVTNLGQAATPGVKMDKLRSRQIYSNLLNNAIKFSEPGSTIEWYMADTVLNETNMTFVTTITDHGCGMSNEFMQHMFEPFTQETLPGQSQKEGTGLGLSIVKKFVELTGGTIAVESEVGKGTTFTIQMDRELPTKEEVAEMTRNMKTLHKDVAILNGKRLLLCEDHPLNREIAVRLLDKVGATTEYAENGQIGLTMFEHALDDYYDAILMDVRMPIMDGLEATRKIRLLDKKRAATIPIIAMTANAYVEDVQKCLDAGMNAHLAKPIDPKALYDVIIECIQA